jgi:hypothetical protein
MKPVLPLFIFIDACGWEIIKNDAFGRAFAPHRKRLESVFGYSSACVPSIVSGRWPAEHGNWSYFVYDPMRSPFKALRPLRWLPKQITSRRKFRRLLSKFLKPRLNFRGYFDLYNIPFKHISLFDFTEKKNPLGPNGMNRGTNIFDYLEDQEIRYYVSSPERSEEANLGALVEAVRSENVDFAFLYWPGLDGLLHSVGNNSPQIPAKLRVYEAWIERLLREAGEHFESVRLYVFSDHGMANCERFIDLKARIQPLPLSMGKDYVAIYDSTMARFWFFNDRARNLVTDALKQIPQGRILPDAELESMGTLFPDRRFGELIFLLDEGVLTVPSDMGERPLRAMHGYHPAASQSFAALCTSHTDIPEEVRAIPHIYRLMVREADTAKVRNAGERRPEAREQKQVQPLEGSRFEAACRG